MRQFLKIQSSVILGCVALLAALSTGCANDQRVIAQASSAHSSLKPAVMEDPQLADYLQQVGDRIISAAKQHHDEGRGPESARKEDSSWMFDKQKMRFHFVNSKTLNAFTTGGEHMYIYTALFQECKSEDELAAVMSHEFAHVYARHVQHGMNNQLALTAATLTAAGAGYVAGGSEKGATYAGALGGATSLAGNFIGMRYTRDDENEADKLGFSFYVRAGWDPDHFADFFQHMIDKGLDSTPEMMSDHPTLKSRVEKTRERVANMRKENRNKQRPPVANAAQFAALQRRAADLGARMPDDTKIQQTQELLAAMPRSCLTPRDNVNLADQEAAQRQVVEDLTRYQKRAR